MSILASLRSRLTYANVVATIALVAALGTGSAWAAKTVLDGRLLRSGSVGTTKLAPNSVTSAKVRNGSLTRADFASGQLPTGAKGDTGDRGPQGEPGRAGADGAPGANGANGTNGVDGAPGVGRVAFLSSGSLVLRADMAGADISPNGRMALSGAGTAGNEPARAMAQELPFAGTIRQIRFRFVNGAVPSISVSIAVRTRFLLADGASTIESHCEFFLRPTHPVGTENALTCSPNKSVPAGTRVFHTIEVGGVGLMGSDLPATASVTTLIDEA